MKDAQKLNLSYALLRYLVAIPSLKIIVRIKLKIVSLGKILMNDVMNVIKVTGMHFNL